MTKHPHAYQTNTENYMQDKSMWQTNKVYQKFHASTITNGRLIPHVFHIPTSWPAYCDTESWHKPLWSSWSNNVSLPLKVLNIWKFTSYCSLKHLWSGMGEVVPARTSPTLHPPSPPPVHQLSRLALYRVKVPANVTRIVIVAWWCSWQRPSGFLSRYLGVFLTLPQKHAHIRNDENKKKEKTGMKTCVH